MLHHIKSGFEKMIAPICFVFIKLGLTPNWITFLGFLFSLVCGYFFARQQYVPAVIIGVVGGFLDGVDGKVARETGRITRFGAFFDSVMDRLSEVAIGGGILISFNGSEDFFKASLLVFFAISGSLITSYIRARGDAAGYDPKGGFLQRADRGFVLAVFPLVGSWFDKAPAFLLAGVIIIAFASWFTVIQRMVLVGRNLKD